MPKISGGKATRGKAVPALMFKNKKLGGRAIKPDASVLKKKKKPVKKPANKRRVNK